MKQQVSASPYSMAPAASDRTQEFTGREWVFSAIDEWLSQSGPRTFLLTGEPGSGKSAIASRLLEIAAGQSLPDAPFAHLTPGSLSAAHFCSARAQRSLTPHAFTESISLQLARYPAFAQALLERSGHRQIRIVVRQEIGELHGSAVGVVIERLDLSGIAPEDGFTRTVREPITALLEENPALQLCILVDALDEALLYSGPVGIVALLAQNADLPDRVRFIVTGRPDERILNAFTSARVLDISGAAVQRENQSDIARYVFRRLTTDVAPRAQPAALGAADLASRADEIASRAGGNFQYVRFFLDAVAAGVQALDDVAGLPRGLNGLYLESLNRVVGFGAASWATAYAPLLGVLSVARDSLTLPQLQALSAQGDAEFWQYRGDLRQFIESVQRPGPAEPCYRLYHQSFADFLRLPVLSIDGREVLNSYYLPAAGWHARIAAHFLALHSGYWTDCNDGYALRYLASHLADAARDANRMQRHARVAELVALVTDREFQTAHQARLEDMLALQRDLEQAVECAATDRHPDAVRLVVSAALEIAGVRRRHLPPGAVFDLARAGSVVAAAGRLTLYGLESEWRQAICLTLAWLGAAADPDGARTVRDEVIAEGLATPLDLLLARLEVTLRGAPPPVLSSLPPAPDAHFVAGILERLGGGNSETVIEPLAIDRVEGIHGDLEGTPTYLAEQDGPLLVAYATADPVHQTRPFREYVAAHAANSYHHYRNRSLWALVAPVLHHPDPAWALDMLAELGEAALAAPQVDLREGLPLALRAIRERAGLLVDVPTFADRVADARAQASALQDARENDPWAHLARRLAVMAEVQATVLGDRTGASLLLDGLRALPFGFAGFRAPAWLAVADTVHVCQSADAVALANALDEALQAAHNIQDHVLCARATSRVNAMRQRWLPAGGPAADVVTAVERALDPASGMRRAALHIVGERYRHRVQSPQRIQIPGWAMYASTLGTLARVHGCSESALMQLNPELAPDATAPLPDGTPVRVPDSGFPPLLAASLAAEASSAPGLTPRARVELLQRLVPMAAADPTALDLVLMRLVLSARPLDAATLGQLAAIVAPAGDHGSVNAVPQLTLPPRGMPA